MHDLLRKASRASLSEISGGTQRNLQAPCTQDVPDNKNPSQDGAPLPSAPPIPPSNAIPRNILAFRTITTLLSQIRQENMFQISHLDSRFQDSDERLELKLSDAFSTVAVIEDEVVAVVTRRIPGQRLEVVACTQHSKNKNTLTVQPSPSSRLVSHIWHLLVNQNYGGGDTQAAVLDPIIGDVLDNLDVVDNEALNRHLEEHWSQSKVARHLWIVSKLLSTKDPTVIYHRLTRYIMATCYPKMIRRVNNKALSQPYIESLKRVKTFQFNESLRDRSSRRENLSDRHFLVMVVLTVGPALDILIPNLTKQAELAMHDKLFQLYTEDTSAEFHIFLVKVLERFQMRLKELADLQVQGPEKVPTEGSRGFQKCVGSALACAEVLRLLSKTAAIKMHLKTIQHLLWFGDDHTDKAIQPFVSAEGVEEEIDDELRAVQPFMMAGGMMKPRWESYLDWLKLMVAHLTAAGDLVAYVTGPHFKNQTISLQIIDAPPADQSLLPWWELLTDSTLFPTETVDDFFFASDGGITNAGILEFLNEAIETSSEAKTVKKLWDEKDIEGTIPSFEKIQDSNFLGWGKRAKEQLVKLRQLNGPPDDALSREISKAIESLCDSAKFFDFLGELRDFSGTMHCEACLASLLNETTTAGESPLEDFGPFIGVSQRSCCPTCQHLFSLLRERRDRPLVVTASHKAITPCTLPTWLPAHIVDSMNQFAGSQLRKELVEIVNRSEILRDPSTDLDWLTGCPDDTNTNAELVNWL